MEVTNTIPDNGDGGVKTATVTSYPAYIAVEIPVLAIGGFSAQNKVYDGTTTAEIVFNQIPGQYPGITGMNVGTDDVTLHQGTLEFAQADAGNDIPVTLVGWYLEGTDSGNYILVLPATLKANITKAAGASVQFNGDDFLTITNNSISIGEGGVTLITPTGQDIEYMLYSRGVTGDSGNEQQLTTWQTSPIFTGLHAYTVHRMVFRSAENNNYTAGTPVSKQNFSSGSALRTLEPVVHFESNGGNPLPDVTAGYGLRFWPEPPAISRANYTFDWWYSNEAMTTPYYLPARVYDNMTLYAKWVYNPDIAAMDAKDMVFIKGGSNYLGSYEEPGRGNNESQHSVVLSGFWMGRYEVTQEKWEAIMGSNPSSFKTAVADEDGTPGKLPVENINWYHALMFCNKLSMAEGLEPVYRKSGSTDPANWGNVPANNTYNTEAWRSVTIVDGANGYRLPTEAQWEYASRAGVIFRAWSSGSNDETSPDLKLYAWYTSSAKSKTHRVGLKLPNPWGLYDMHGNVAEWCWDGFSTSSIPDYSPLAEWGEVVFMTNPTTPPSSAHVYRAVRGGRYNSTAAAIRSAARSSLAQYNAATVTGLRLVRPLD